MKKILIALGILMVIFCAPNMVNAQECVTPLKVSCDGDCKISNPNYSTDGTAGAAYYACYKTCTDDNALREKIYRDCLLQQSGSVMPENTPALIKYFAAGDIKKGDVITAPITQKVNIIMNGQKIDLMEGSVIKYIDAYTWQIVKGLAHFVEKLDKAALNGRYKVKSTTAVCAVRGTQFTMEVGADGTTKVIVTEGLVNITPTAKGKKAVDVKEGYQLIIDKKAAGKSTKIDPAKIDKWYETLPADSNFINSSWQKVTATDRYQRECVFTAGLATAAETITAEEQEILNTVNENLPIYRAKANDSLIEKDKKLSSFRERITSAGKVSAQIFITPTLIYYPSDKVGIWTAYQDKTFINNIFQGIHQEGLNYDFDKSTLTFQKWQGTGKNRLAIYSGNLTSKGTNDVIKTGTTQNQEDGQTVGSVKIYIDEASQLWSKTEVTINVKSGKLLLPLYQTCKNTYGDAVKITVPTKLKKVDAKTGLSGLNKILSSF